MPLLGAVDTALVGHLDEVYYLGAIAVGGMIFNFLFWGFGFLRMGTTGLTAQAYGKEDRVEATLTLARALLVALAASLAMIVLQVFIADLSFSIISASPEVEHFTRIYFNIRIYAAPATLGIYALNGWFLGMQNARYPMWVTIFLNVLNVGLDVFFVYGAGMNVAGVAWGTLIARYAGLVLAVFLLMRHYGDWLRDFARERLLELKALKKYFMVNRDIFIRTLCLIFTMSFFTAKSAAMGDRILAANSILLQLWMIISYGIDGFAYAAESLVGRYTGARNYGQLKKAIQYAFGWGLGIGLAGSLVYWGFEGAILSLFTDNLKVIETAGVVFLWVAASPVINSISFIWDGVFIGATATVPMRNSMLIATFLCFLPAYYLAEEPLGVHALWLAMVVFMLARGLTLSLFAPKFIFKRHRSVQSSGG